MPFLRFLEPRTTPRNPRRRRRGDLKASEEPVSTGTPETAAESPWRSPNAETPNTNRTDANTNDKEECGLPLDELFRLLDKEVRVNIGTSVKCGICLSTMEQPERTPCGHAFCKDCIRASLMANQKCPECNAAITKRSLQPHLPLRALAKTYKDLSLIHI